MALSLLALATAPTPLVAADTPAEKQMDFGADMARRGLWKEALFRFQQADRLDPDNPRILNNIAVSFEALGLFDQALEAYQKALRVATPDDELRANYSQFAEFYQSFKPRDGEDEQGAPAVAATRERPPVDDELPEGDPSDPAGEDGR